MADVPGGTKGNKVTVHDDGSATVAMTKLRIVVTETGLPSYQVGALAGIHHSTMSEYMQGKRSISHKHLHRLSKVLEVPPDDLVGWDSFHVEPGTV